MAEMSGNGSERQLSVRHLSRIGQIGIFFGKFVRMFVYQSDWKVLPMAALIAGLVGFALGGNFGVSMEGTLTGAFAIVCVCIWNGSFNSIQVICRERGIVKREHRAGMHPAADSGDADRTVPGRDEVPRKGTVYPLDGGGCRHYDASDYLCV